MYMFIGPHSLEDDHKDGVCMSRGEWACIYEYLRVCRETINGLFSASHGNQAASLMIPSMFAHVS